jgi:aquacobalamin reductase/NAD(P)H-flavin reductase
MKEINCRVHAITPLTSHVYKVLLKPAEQVDFIAGQYLNFVMSSEDKRPFSIASAPGAEFIELQVGAFGADSYPMQVIERINNAIATDEEITIEIPLGNAQLRTKSERPLLLMAGGTGFSYIKSMFEYLVQQKTTREVVVYWGLREPNACYELEQTANLLASLPKAKFIPVVEQKGCDWQGRTGLVHQAVMTDIDNLSAYDIYLAGRFEMIALVRDDFVKKGALIENMYADAFAFI